MIKVIKRRRSLSSRLLAVIFRCVPRTDIREARNYKRALAKSLAPYVLPKYVRSRYGFRELDGFADTFVIGPEAGKEQMTILYLHGGAYWAQPLLLHFRGLKELPGILNARLILPVYPKAPSYTALDVHKMIMERYIYLIGSKEIPAESIVLMGDSAGGGLALAFLQALRDNHLPMPREAVLLSPWLDVANSNPAMKPIQRYDPLLNIESVTFQGKIYAGDLQTNHPLVSPLYGDLSGLPPVTVYIGTYDILYADMEEYERIAQEQGLDVTIYVYEKMNHCFQGYPIPEGKDARERIIRYLQKSIQIAEMVHTLL